MPLSVTALDGIPEIFPGDDLGALIADAARTQGVPIGSDDVVVIAHKVVSKAEGRIRRLAEVEPQTDAQKLADELGKDPRLVQIVLDESREVLRASRGVLITVTHHGFVCANAGVDASNVPGDDAVVLLPDDPDGSARSLRARMKHLLSAAPAVLITDSFGRAWRQGQLDVAIGCAGLFPLEDWRGRTDKDGRELKATWIAVADELAAAADLARTKDGSRPVILIGGAGRHVIPDDGPGAAAIIRPESQDLFR
ncbi:MAG TPA: coenzyme F420-0:L-glutamate ligase [Solirubrobacteraceae bacterium]|nr:coenzyme F420-0:L-glutamate ligase [Solirubrobacteraceae bacterium]